MLFSVEQSIRKGRISIVIQFLAAVLGQLIGAAKIGSLNRRRRSHITREEGDCIEILRIESQRLSEGRVEVTQNGRRGLRFVYCSN